MLELKCIFLSLNRKLILYVCSKRMFPNVFVQCSNGHTLCSGCKPRVHNRCPTCRHELGNIRCLALEKVAASLELPCKYQNFGCLGIYPYYCKLKHESQCQYRPYTCPYAGSECTVVGDIPYLVNHLKDDHKVDMHSGSTFNHRYVKSNPHEVENATWMLTVMLSNLCNLWFCHEVHVFAFFKCLLIDLDLSRYKFLSLGCHNC
jgi:E3 ubiquitin-protein ligase SIAH1